MLYPENILTIEEHIIKAKYDCSITIDLNDYTNVVFIETSEHYFMPGAFDVWVPEYRDFTQIILPYSVRLLKTDNLEENRSLRIINYKKNKKIIEQETVDETTDMGFIRKLLDGNIKYIRTPEILTNFLSRSFADIDLLHLELIVSNMFRSEKDIQKLCRWTGNYKNSVILGQSKQPLMDSWTRAMAFQHIDKAFTQGLVSGQTTPDNAFDKILSNDFS
jgi:hypothetical protein